MCMLACVIPSQILFALSTSVCSPKGSDSLHTNTCASWHLVKYKCVHVYEKTPKEAKKNCLNKETGLNFWLKPTNYQWHKRTFCIIFHQLFWTNTTAVLCLQGYICSDALVLLEKCWSRKRYVASLQSILPSLLKSPPRRVLFLQT